MLKFIHAADIHLDSPMRGLPNYPGAPIDEIRGATRRALEALVTLATDEAVDLVLIAGDLYDGDWRDYNTGLFLANQMSRLRQAGIRVVIASGNHDAASQITRHLKLPDNVTRLSTKHPETVAFEDLGVAVHGQGFAERHVLENVTLAYPPPRADLFNIGMLHTSAGCAGHDEYAPCSKQDLLARGYQYWSLGHIHRHEVMSSDPWILFSGNLQGRHIRETGPKGCVVVTVDDDIALVERRDLAVVRWEVCPVSGSDCQDAYELLERMRGQLEALLDACPAPTLATRIVVAGAAPARDQLLAEPERWLNEARRIATEVGGGRVWLEKLEIEPNADDAPVIAKSFGDTSAVAALQRLDLNPASIEALAGDAALRDLMTKVPRELLEQAQCEELSAETLAKIVPRARAMLLAALQTGGEEA
jgi:DNA repair protein SbcD/Mre11